MSLAHDKALAVCARYVTKRQLRTLLRSSSITERRGLVTYKVHACNTSFGLAITKSFCGIIMHEYGYKRFAQDNPPVIEIVLALYLRFKLNREETLRKACQFPRFDLNDIFVVFCVCIFLFSSLTFSLCRMFFFVFGD